MSEAGEMGQAPLYLAGELLRDSEKPAEDWIRPPPPNSCFSGTAWIYGTGRSGLSSWLLEETQELWCQGKAVCFNGQKT